MMLNTVNPSTSTLPAAKQANAPAGAKDAPTAAAPAQSTADGAAPAPGKTFARWLGLQNGAGAQAPAAAVADPATDAAAQASASTDAPSAAVTDTAPVDDAATPDNPLLAAMTMPLMPLSPQQVTQAVQAAQGSAHAGTDDAGKADTPAQPPAVSGQDARRASIALPQAVLAQAAQQDTTAANVRLAVQGNAANGNAGTGGQDAGTDGSGAQGVQPGTATAAPVAGAVPLPAAQPAADTVKLAGPPTAWRQTLQETLGDRLNVHVAGNVQQATISIEPPQLGRIDIAIRHSAGTLEVNISATNGDVLRQLQTVSDNLRNDLSQRQYTEVAVTVTPAPKNNAAPFSDPQQQGRGRQQGRDQDNEPGRGLAEAGNPASVFNLGRDS
ncbi:flagellar hook-length control protein FliK [Telluria mixta]|uniref:Flagellar hook-length control protein FliK n=1 Tax=Telluria mixta TaxID=34071 RepID=A0ABT2BXJ0_9BURK|nr:flagellar hook-length control protein FliK [Telluria mixta]MCS0629860.1 flagellar hook-length control protein FliK [Telluria mixta]WEM96584.1 flagellar hook-length control protein FliK [Telluria mixta]